MRILGYEITEVTSLLLPQTLAIFIFLPCHMSGVMFATVYQIMFVVFSGKFSI